MQTVKSQFVTGHKFNGNDRNDLSGYFLSAKGTSIPSFPSFLRDKKKARKLTSYTSLGLILYGGLHKYGKCEV